MVDLLTGSIAVSHTCPARAASTTALTWNDYMDRVGAPPQATVRRRHGADGELALFLAATGCSPMLG
jgi:hypothetical protein